MFSFRADGPLYRARFRSSILIAFAAGWCALFPGWAMGQHINEDFKLLASDGVAGDSFGGSRFVTGGIAIDNGIIAVSAYRDDDNGTDSGSAYLFDAFTGAQLHKLLPIDGSAGDLFGTFIDIDSGIVAVGVPLDDDNGTDSGAVYLFDAFTGAQLFKLLASDGAAFDNFGLSIAIDNGIVAVGAPLGQDDNGTASGSAYLFNASTGVQIAKLLPDDGAAQDNFGRSIAIVSDLLNGIVAVGSPGDNDNGRYSGSAYLFDASTGVQITKLLPADGTSGDNFGSSIDIALADGINQGFVAVGAPYDDDIGIFSGSAYLFDAVTGAEINKVFATDEEGDNFFGMSVAVSNENLVVGSEGGPDNQSYSGSAYLFDVSSGDQIAIILPSDAADFGDSVIWGGFGKDIDLDNGIIAVGAFNGEDANGIRTGAAYVFDNTLQNNGFHKLLVAESHLGYSTAIDNGIVAVAVLDNIDGGAGFGWVYVVDASTGLQIAKVAQSDPLLDDQFGRAVDIDIVDNAGNGIVAVGARRDDDNGFRSGSAYLFDAATGAQLFKLLPNDGAAGDVFGFSIAIDNGIVAVGAPSLGSNPGAAYLFDAPTGTQLAKIIPNDGALGDQFGESIALANGIVAVGAPTKDDNGSDSGAVYLFNASTGVQLFKLLPSDGAAGDWFGDSIAVANGIVAICAPLDDDNGSASGSAYLFDVSTGLQIAKLLPSDGSARQGFGESLAMAQGVVAIGAFSDDDNGIGSGSAYLFDASTGAQIDKLVPNDGSAEDLFGWSIAIDNDFVVAGAPQDDYYGPNAGSAYVFDAPIVAPTNKLVPVDGDAGDGFGNAVAVDNGILAVGAIFDGDNGSNAGSAYLFDALTRTQIAKLLPSDGAAADNFGKSIAMDRDIVAIGAFQDDDNGLFSGSAYLFSATTGAQLFKLLPSDGATDDGFGASIAISNGMVAIGSLRDDDNGANSGSAYLFDASTGVQMAKLLPGDGASNDLFGSSIALDGGIVAVGAPEDDDNDSNSGSVYLFDASTGDQIAKIVPGDGSAEDYFGFSITIRRGVLAVGAPFDDDHGTDSGSAYLFDALTGVQMAKLLPGDGAMDDWFGYSISMDSTVVAVGARFDDDLGDRSGSAYVFRVATGELCAKLLAGDGAALDQFGFSISVDRGVVAVGAPTDDDNGIDSGSAYVFTVRCPVIPTSRMRRR